MPCGRAVLGDVDEVARHQLERLGKGPLDAGLGPAPRGRQGPRRLLFVSEGDAFSEGVASCERAREGALDLGVRQALHAGEQLPLVGGGSKVLVHEHALAFAARLALQGQRDEVAEAAPGQRVLSGEEAVVGVEADLVAQRRRAREQGAPQAPRLCGRDRLREEDPDVRALAGA